jgi:hypothetical protein
MKRRRMSSKKVTRAAKMRAKGMPGIRSKNKKAPVVVTVATRNH